MGRARRILDFFSREKAGKPKPPEKVNQHLSSGVTGHPAPKLEQEGESKTPVVSKSAEASSAEDANPEKITAAEGQDTASAGLTGLWDEAYKIVEKEKPELLATYERYLLLSKEGQQESAESDEPAAQPSITPSTRVKQEEIRELAQSKLNAVQQGHLKVIVKGKEIVIKEKTTALVADGWACWRQAVAFNFSKRLANKQYIGWVAVRKKNKSSVRKSGFNIIPVHIPDGRSRN